MLKRLFLAVFLIATPAAAQTPEPDIISSSSLNDLDYNGAGLQGLRSDAAAPLWKNAGKAAVSPLLNELKQGNKYPVLKDILTPLLTQESPAPRDYSTGGAPFLMERAAVLYAFGASTQAKQLLALVPPQQRGFEAQQLLAAILLTEGKFEAGCPVVAEALKLQNDALLLALQFVCARQQQQPAAADLALTLLDEITDSYRVFYALASQCQHGGALPSGLPQTPVDVPLAALLRVCSFKPGTVLPLSVDLTTPVPLLAVLASTNALPLEVQTSAAELALEHGVIEPQRLALLYELSAGFPSGEAAPATMLRSSAQLWQDFKRETALPRKFALAAAALERSAISRTQTATVRLYQPQLRSLNPGSDVSAQKTLLRFAALMGSEKHFTARRDSSDETLLLYAWGLQQGVSDKAPQLWDEPLLAAWHSRFAQDGAPLVWYLEASGYAEVKEATTRRRSEAARKLQDADASGAPGLVLLQAAAIVQHAYNRSAPPGDSAAAFRALVDAGNDSAARRAALELSILQGL